MSYVLVDQGHTFWVNYFPSGNATWVYDAATQTWSEWDYLDPVLGPVAHRSQCHCFAFGKHLVGDWKTGTIYEMNINFYDDFGSPLRRLRRAPHISTEQERIAHAELIIDLEVGLGSAMVLTGASSAATATLITLADAIGGLWNLGIAESGIIQTTGGAMGTAQQLFLNDPLGTTSWQITVSVRGIVRAVPVTFASTYPVSVSFVSTNATQLWFLQVTDQGIVQAVANGVPADVAGNVSTRGPLLQMRYSNDSCRTWTAREDKDFGQLGEYLKRVVWRRLGMARDRVYEVSCSDPVPVRFINAYLKAEGQNSSWRPTERLAKNLGKQA
jgi:hypothetical protein